MLAQTDDKNPGEPMPEKVPTYPVSKKQQWRLNVSTHPNHTTEQSKEWILAHAILVSPSVDLRRLERAVNAVWARHDSLRIRFGRVRDQWLASIAPHERFALRRIDIGESDDSVFQAHIFDIATSNMQLMGGALAEVLVVHCGKRGDVVLTRAHNLICDGYSLVVLLEDLMKALLGIPFSGEPVSHADYLARYDRYDAERERATAPFWENMLRDFPQPAAIGNKSTGKAVIGEGVGRGRMTGIMHQSIHPASMQRLKDYAEKQNLALPTALFTGFLHALSQQFGLDPVMFSSPVARIEPGLRHAICDHSFAPIYRYEPDPQEDMSTAMQRLDAMMLEALHHMPADAVRRGGTAEQRLIASGRIPRQFNAFQPTAQSRINQSDLFGRSQGWYGDTFSVGGNVFRKVDISQKPRTWGDIDFQMLDPFEPPGFILKYNCELFEHEELIALSERICGLLELQSP